MRFLSSIWRRLLFVANRDELDRRLDEEIDFHLEQLTKQRAGDGSSPETAARQAVLAFGGVAQVKEQTRDQFRLALLQDSARDLSYCLRGLRRAPMFTAVAVATLAIGIGATTAIFSVLNGVLLKPLPYRDSERLVDLGHTAPGLNTPGKLRMSLTQYLTYREENRTFQAIGLWTAGTSVVQSNEQFEEVLSVLVTEGTLQALDVRPLLGRSFERSDETLGSPETAMLSFDYWRNRYGSDASIIGRNITVESRPHQIIGILPKGFRFPGHDPAIVLSHRFNRNALYLGGFNFEGLARLKRDAPQQDAVADLARMIPIWLGTWPLPPGMDRQVFESARFTPLLRPLKDEVIGPMRNVLWTLSGTIGIVLIIACANVANLLLIRAEGRQREFALRTALGAGRMRLGRQLFLESVALGLLGGVFGVVVAYAAVRVLLAAGPATLPRLNEVTIDGNVLLFALCVSLVSGGLFAVLPVARYTGPDIARLLRSGSRTVRGGARQRTRSLLVVAQVALALVLLVASGLMIRTFVALQAVDPGFRQPDHVLLMRVAIPETQVAHAEDFLLVGKQVRDRLASIPGVSAVAFASSAPLQPDGNRDGVFVEGADSPPGELPPVRRFKFVSPGYFQAIGATLTTGRDFTWTDLTERRHVVIVSENLAREIWKDPAAAVGKRIRESRSSPWREIIGVVSDVRDQGLDVPPSVTAYWPVGLSNFWGSNVLALRAATFLVRSPRATSEDFAREVIRNVSAVNASLPVTQVNTLETLYDRSLARTSFALILLTIAGAMALFLSIIGIYGVVAYTVSQRRREIGIRVALGAGNRQLRYAFVRHGLLLTAVGAACGIVTAAVLTRFMGSMLFGVTALDAGTYVVVSLLLILVAAVASYVPAHRATIVDPAEVLRTD